MQEQPNIHVGIVKSPQITIKLHGKFKLGNSEIHCFNYCKAFINNNKIVFEGSNVTHEFTDSVVLMPCNITADKFEIKDVVIGIDFHWEQKEDQQFQGALKIIRSGNELQAINVIPVENYLISVISSEMSANSSLSLLKAHAIISRSWLLAQINKQTELVESKANYTLINETEEEYIRWYDREDHTDFHVCADDHCQRYQGVTRAHNPNVIKAVQETCGEVLQFEDKICDARFSKCCGGATETFENCWEPIHHPYLLSIADKEDESLEKDLCNEPNAKNFILGSPDSFCNTTNPEILSQVLNDYDLTAKDFYRWTVVYSQDEISKLIEKKSGKNFGKIKDLIPVARGKSGRLIKLMIVGENLTLTIGKELEIRRLLSESHLYSSAIVIEKTDSGAYPQGFVIRGAGWGHGVGLCQIGAAVMGDKGYDYKEILGHYFKATEIKKHY